MEKTFKNPDINDRYRLISDATILIPGKYRGKISDMRDAGLIEGLIARGSNLVARRNAPAKPEAAAKK